MKKIVILEPGFSNYETEKSILAQFKPQIIAIKEDASDAHRKEAVRDAHAIFARDFPVSTSLIQQMRCCQLIARYGIGYDNVDTHRAKKQRIFVTNIPSYGAEEVSNHALLLALAASRHIVDTDKKVRQGHWQIVTQKKIWGFKDQTLGLIGFGHIARCFYKKAMALGFNNCLVYDPFLDPKMKNNYNIHPASLEELCEQSHLISLHAPLNEETRHMINTKTLSLMNPKTIIVNTSRGGLIKESDLHEALLKNQIFAAGLDVFSPEPPKADNPLFHLDNIVVSDHAAWYSESSIMELQQGAALEALRVFSGRKPASWVNPW